MGARTGYEHGTLSAYTKAKCRCDVCRQEWRDYQVAWKARIRRSKPPVYEHGTRNCYIKTKCRCEPCRIANGAYFAAWKAKNPGKFESYIAVWKAANPGRKALLERVRYQANLEHCRAVQLANDGRRRQRRSVAMDATDRMLSVAYRLAIKRDLCAYCGSLGQEDDHVIPLARNGTDHWWNLVRACTPCNRSKGSKLLGEWLGRPDLLCQLDLDPEVGGTGTCDVDVGGEIISVGQGCY